MRFSPIEPNPGKSESSRYQYLDEDTIKELSKKAKGSSRVVIILIANDHIGMRKKQYASRFQPSSHISP